MNSTLGTDINVLCDLVLAEPRPVYHIEYQCPSCRTCRRVREGSATTQNQISVTCSSYRWKRQVSMDGTARSRTPAEWMRANFSVPTSHLCTDCGTSFVRSTVIKTAPTFIRFIVDKIQVKWTYTVQMEGTKYRLCGFIYYGRNHFTCRVVTRAEEVWFNDGMVDGKTYHFENKLENMQPRHFARATDDRLLVSALYVKC